jgi:hypothetical protein
MRVGIHWCRVRHSSLQITPSHLILDQASKTDVLQFLPDWMERFGRHRFSPLYFSHRTFARTWSMVTLPMTSRGSNGL